jgi:hypothetical protein
MEKSKYIKRGVKGVGRTVLGSAELLAGLVGIAVFPVIELPLSINGAQNVLKGVRGEYIKDSMINVISNKFYSKSFHGKENRIVQEFPTIKQFVTAVLTKNKMNFLLMQELNFLLGSDTVDRKGEKIKYTTYSQGLTKLMLTRLQKSGMIENLESTEAKPKMLFSEKIMPGNTKKGLFKKENMFEMSFFKADKKISEEDIKKFLRIDTSDKENYDIKRDKDNNILSINYRTSKLIKDKLSKVKDKFLPARDIPQMLNASKDEEQKPLNVLETKKTLSQELNSFINKQEEINTPSCVKCGEEINLAYR